MIPQNEKHSCLVYTQQEDAAPWFFVLCRTRGMILAPFLAVHFAWGVDFSLRSQVWGRLTGSRLMFPGPQFSPIVEDCAVKRAQRLCSVVSPDSGLMLQAECLGAFKVSFGCRARGRTSRCPLTRAL